MSERPPWAQQSDIWNSVSKLHDDRNFRGLQILDQTNGGDLNQQLPLVERRIALEVYEAYSGGPYPRIEAYAYEQTISPSAEKSIIKSNQIGSCIGQIFDREHALNNCFTISAQNAGHQTRTFVDCVYDDAGNLLPKPVDYNPFAEDDDTTTITITSPLANHDLVSEHSFVLVEGIRVDASHRRRGVGRALLNALLAEALLSLPSIRFAASWPCSSDSTDLPAEPPGPPCPSSTPPGTAEDGGAGGGGSDGGCSRRAGRAQKRAEAFHRATGFRRLGLTRFWAKRLE